MKILKNLVLLSTIFISLNFANAQDLKPLKEDILKEILKESDDKVVVINLWAYWCGPCKEEFPDLVKFGKENSDDSKLILISLDETADLESKTKPFLAKNNVDFVSYYNAFDKDEKLINMLDKNWEGAIPSTFFFKDGKLVKSLVGKQTESQFKKAFDEVNQ
ncbi:MAG: TlpA family protein disulfide reductase [Ignavibacteria bacterium]|nr:TlpA family protein disulfide reductase [Ignavibacteria bacterium]